MKGYKYFLYLVAITTALLAGVELVSFYILQSRGVASPIFFSSSRSTVIGSAKTLNTLDPNLGFAHGLEEENVVAVRGKYSWSDGFLIYSKDPSNLQRPVILALGGSTTDGILFGHSWPEHLASILRENNLQGTVVNGGVAGYSTSQGVFKLVRDGLDFHPDIVISWDGINDRGDFSTPSYPMIHPYQVRLLRAMVGLQPDPSLLFPSSITLLQLYLRTSTKHDIGYTLGLPTMRSLAENYEKNMRLMNAISRTEGAAFYAFVQPFASYRSKHDRETKRPIDFINSIVNLYDEITKLPARYDYIRNATQILENVDGVYTDGVHLTSKGDRIVAEYVFQSIQSQLTLR